MSAAVNAVAFATPSPRLLILLLLILIFDVFVEMLEAFVLVFEVLRIRQASSAIPPS